MCEHALLFLGEFRGCYLSLYTTHICICARDASDSLFVAHTLSILPLQVHDSVAYSKTSVAKLISEGRLPDAYHIVCDNAYPLGPQALIPYKGTGLRVEQSAYNYFVSLHRQVHCVITALIIGLEHRACIRNAP